MQLTSKDRNRLRKLQDQIIRMAVKAGYKDDMRVSRFMPEDVTLGSLRTTIYPDYESELKDVRMRLTYPKRSK